MNCIHSMITCMSIRCRNSYFFRIHEKGGNLQKQYASIYLRPQSEHGYLLFILVSSCKQHCELIYEIVKPVLILNEKCELQALSHTLHASLLYMGPTPEYNQEVENYIYLKVNFTDRCSPCTVTDPNEVQ